MDELTNQFNMDEYIEGYKTTSLSLEQKTLAFTEFKSCVTANFTTPSLPLFIRLTESSIEILICLFTYLFSGVFFNERY